MTHTRSLIIWDHISILATFQFPWRFLSLAIFCVAVLNGIVITTFPKKWQPFIGLGLIIVMLIRVSTYFNPVYFLNSSQEYYYDDQYRIQTEMSKTWPDFLPKTFVQPEEELPLISGEVSDVIILEQTSKRFKARVNTDSSTPISLHIANFPGWTGSINSQKFEIQSDLNGLISMEIPNAGTYVVEAELHRTQLQLISDIISLGSIFILVFIVMMNNRQMLKTVIHPSKS